jgi:DnaJ-domain-containing protein 1
MSDGGGLGGLGKPLAEMSDRELEEELQRRRRMRAAAKRPEAPITEAERNMLRQFERAQGGVGGGGGGASWVAEATDRVDLARHYAALELQPGATLAQVESSYRALMAKYDPDKHARDPERHRAAVRLVQELGRAHEALTQRLRK